MQHTVVVFLLRYAEPSPQRKRHAFHCRMHTAIITALKKKMAAGGHGYATTRQNTASYPPHHMHMHNLRYCCLTAGRKLRNPPCYHEHALLHALHVLRRHACSSPSSCASSAKPGACIGMHTRATAANRAARRCSTGLPAPAANAAGHGTVTPWRRLPAYWR